MYTKIQSTDKSNDNDEITGTGNVIITLKNR